MKSHYIQLNPNEFPLNPLGNPSSRTLRADPKAPGAGQTQGSQAQQESAAGQCLYRWVSYQKKHQASRIPNVGPVGDNIICILYILYKYIIYINVYHIIFNIYIYIYQNVNIYIYIHILYLYIYIILYIYILYYIYMKLCFLYGTTKQFVKFTHHNKPGIQQKLESGVPFPKKITSVIVSTLVFFLDK